MTIRQYPHQDEALGFISRFNQKVNGKVQLVAATVNGVDIPPYIPSDDLKDLVRLAQIIKRPVLIKGDPGSGKTELARSVAYEWYGVDYEKYFFKWVVKSTSKAVDGLYYFDHVARLRDAQLAKHNRGFDSTRTKKYRTFGPMGEAFRASNDQYNPPILLIDEIDKADIDFPNDLLLELDKYTFTIKETGETITAKYPPLIFITSNDERELPEAFLRRCLFCFIKFPSTKQLKSIIAARLPVLVENNEKFVDNAIARFRDLREKIRNNPSDNKQVSTSELLDWLTSYDFNKEDDQILTDPLDDLPHYHQTLLKTYAALVSEKKVKDKDEDDR